ncbi:hypothetical protein HQ571_03905 [Candidatus Kuenenbacteria bacterium]|nr:hypothetical protein [Candidatus Kuenenbacteria bacterium]
MPEEQKPVEDMFAGVEKTPEVSVAQPQPVQPVQPIQPVPKTKSYLPAIIVLVIIVLIAILAGVVVFKFVLNSDKNDPTDAVVQEQEEEEDEKKEVEDTAVKTDEPAEKKAQDSDSDGLSNAEESELGTNPMKMDTDADGVFDYDEVKLYKTDPLDSDTDGDSFLDGEEILKGYNPKGPGKLLNFESAKNSLESKVKSQ